MSLRRVIREGVIANDDCAHVADDAPLPAAGAFTLSLERYRREKAAGAGVRLPNDVDADAVWPEISGAPLIALTVPKFGDGRAMSQARVLRERCGYNGELRAIGDVQRDQMFYMRRCGINVFEVRPDRSIEDALKAFNEFSVTYQGSADWADSIFRRRRTATGTRAS